MSSLDSNLDLRDLQALRNAGLVSAGRYRTALNLVRDEAFWARWGRRALLALGAAQLLAGIVFFFAYNWNDLSDFAKFAVVESAIVIAAMGALAIGLDRAVGQVLLIAASILTGVLLAVIGQVYQTGADAFELFVAWAALILPWAIISRSAAHWLIWLVVAEFGLALYGDQVLLITARVELGDVWVLVGGTIALALMAREVAVSRGFQWLSAHWTRLVLLFAALAALFIPAAAPLIDDNEFGSEPLCIGAFLIVSAVAAFVYARRWPDLAATVIVIGFADLFFIALGFYLIDETIGFNYTDAGIALTGFGAMILWAVLGTGGAAYAMRHMRARLKVVAA